MKNYIIILILMFIGANEVSAQKTIEKIGKAAEVVNTTGNVIKSLGGLFGKKNKKTDSLPKQKGVENPIENKEVATVANEGRVMDKMFVAKAVFGKQKNETEMLWKANSEEKIDDELVNQVVSADGYYHTVVSELIEFEVNGIKNVTALLITYNYSKDEKGKLRKNESRAASPGIGFANFMKTEEGNWQLTKVNRLASRVGSNGEVPDFERIDIASDLNCISFTESYGMGGQNETHQSFYAINADYLGKRILNIALLESWDGDENSKGAYKIIRTFKMLENNTGINYPDILVNEIKNKKSQPTVLYTFSKEKAEYIQKTKVVGAEVAAKKSNVKKVASTVVKKATPPAMKPKPAVKTASIPTIKY